MLPIYLKDQEFTSPDDPLYYLLTKDGLFLVKSTPFFAAAVPVQGIPWLEAQEPEVRLTAPPLPAALLLQALSFCRAVFSRYKSEAVALLAWRETDRTYELVIPHQTVGGGHCDYEIKDFPPGFTRLGTIHSHAAVAAFHSERDEHDERYEDGFHLTLGNLDGDLTLSCSVVVQGLRGYIPPERLFAPYPIPWDQAPPEAEWAAEVDDKVTPLPRPIEFGT
ncbi:MAG: Mov34/MPN/PAD-1 family protein [Thermodesulfobacteriota bacterium]